MEEQSDSKGSTILIAMDESDHSFYALEWALNTLISHEDGNEENKNKKKTKNVILAHARLHPTASAGLGGAGIYVFFLCSYFSLIMLSYVKSPLEIYRTFCLPSRHSFFIRMVCLVRNCAFSISDFLCFSPIH